MWGHHKINKLAVFAFALVCFSETLSETNWRRTTLFSGIADLSFLSKLSTHARTRQCILVRLVADSSATAQWKLENAFQSKWIVEPN